MLEKNLEKLGFYKNEAKVYLALLELGFCTTGPLIKKTGLHRNIVYESLDKLIAHGLVSSSTQRGKKHFRTLSPDRILKQEKIRFESAQELVGELAKLQKKEKQEIIVYEDKAGFHNAHFDAIEQMKRNDTISVLIAGGDKWISIMESAIKKFDTDRVKKRIKVKIIALENQRKDMTDQAKRSLFEARFLQKSFDNPADTAVYGDITLIMVYGDPVFTIMIKNPRVAKSFKQYFNIFWEMSKK